MKKIAVFMEKFLENISMVLSVGMVVFLFIQLFGRAALRHGFSWTEESAKICLIMLAFVGAAMTSMNGVHVSITILSDALKGVSKKVLYVVQQAIATFFLVLVFIYSFPALQIASKSVTTNTHINNAVIYAVIPISCVIMIFAHVSKIIRQLRSQEYIKERDKDIDTKLLDGSPEEKEGEK